MNLDMLIATSLSRVQRNIHGDLGPRCPTCSGLGSHLRLVDGVRTNHASRCSCDGTGLDIVSIERMDRELLWQQIHKIESKMGLKPTSRYKFPNIKLSRQYWMEAIAWATADGVAVASSTSATILFPNVTIPANYMQDGRALRIRFAGKYSTLGSGTVTHVFDLRWGGIGQTPFTKTGAITLLISMTNAYFDAEVTLQTRSNGSAGTLLADGIVREFGGTAPTIGSATGAPAIAPMTNGGQTVPAAATLDFTADTAFTVAITHGANSASNTATGMHYTIESMN